MADLRFLDSAPFFEGTFGDSDSDQLEGNQNNNRGPAAWLAAAAVMVLPKPPSTSPQKPSGRVRMKASDLSIDRFLFFNFIIYN